ncbi:MAG: hypothetical protein IJV04_02195 [Lachnospiraceae bacterium]|nr:hypothetical protein [Lachnospiraceae bacterium]
METIKHFKYLRIQGRELAANTLYAKGVFSMCWKLIQDDEMDEEDVELYKEIDAWFAEHLPFPEPCMNKEKVICYFKTENSDEMIRLIRPALWLLERYHHPYYAVYTNDPGEIVYEDRYQVAVRIEDPIVEYYEHTWVGQENGGKE